MNPTQQEILKLKIIAQGLHLGHPLSEIQMRILESIISASKALEMSINK